MSKGRKREAARGTEAEIYKEKEGENERMTREDALEVGLSRSARFPDDYSLRGSVFREIYLLRAHKPTETLEKKPASTRLRSKEVAPSEGRRATVYCCWLLKR